MSLSSGKACADALEKEGYQVTRVDVARDVGSVLAELKPDVVFNALHGPFGEDGTIQGILEYLGHSLYPFGRARLGAGHEQGAGQEGRQGGRHSGGGIEGRSTASPSRTSIR